MQYANFLYPLAFAAFVAFCFRVAARVCNKSLSDIILTAFIVFAGSIIISGFVLSELNLINNRRSWAVLVFVPAFVFYIQFTKLFGRDRRDDFTMFEVMGERIQGLWVWYVHLNKFLKSIFFLLLGTFIVVTVTNLTLVCYLPPNEWDSMTGHLVRVMYYLQHGNMNHFGGTNWNIDTYPKSVCTIQIYTYLMSGRIETYFKTIHQVSYWVCVVGAYGIAKNILPDMHLNTTDNPQSVLRWGGPGARFSAPLFAGLVMGLLPNVITQATSTETDIVLCAYLTCLVYFLITYRQTLRRRYLYLSGIAFGMALGHKVTFVLLLPSVAFIMLFALLKGNQQRRRDILKNLPKGELISDFRFFLLRVRHLLVAVFVGVCLFALPTGYLTNIKVFGHPIGPPTALQHQSIERVGNLKTWEGRKNLLKQGTRNVLRYGFDFVNLDGLRNWAWGDSLNRLMKKPLVAVERKLPTRLEAETNFTILPFVYERRFEFFNANPYYGIFGFGLMLPLMLLVMFGFLKSKVHRYLAVAFLLHFVALSFSAAYDPWKGRYFQNTAVFAVPFLVLIFTQTRKSMLQRGFSFLKLGVLLVVIIGCLSALLTVFLNERALPLAALGRPSAFDTERIALQTWARPDLTTAYQTFDSLVPTHATVALADMNDDFEYPLFGKDLSRKLIPINPFEKGMQPIPKEADYLFFAKSVMPPQKGDIRLGTDTTMKGVITKAEDYYLRKLK